MGRRARRKQAEGTADVAPMPDAPTERVEGPGGDVLELRTVLTPKTRTQYQAVRAGKGGAQTQEDAWQRSVEFLFERLAVRWTASGVDWEGPKELLQRFRVAAPDERRWIREALRAHLAEHFPDVEAP